MGTTTYLFPIPNMPELPYDATAPGLVAALRLELEVEVLKEELLVVELLIVELLSAPMPVAVTIAGLGGATAAPKGDVTGGGAIGMVLGMLERPGEMVP